jgi:hypothetical protein
MEGFPTFLRRNENKKGGQVFSKFQEEGHVLPKLRCPLIVPHSVPQQCSELEEATGTFPKLPGKFAIVSLHLSQLLCHFQVQGTFFIIQSNTDLRFLLKLEL